jgi:hypothetical protein
MGNEMSAEGEAQCLRFKSGFGNKVLLWLCGVAVLLWAVVWYVVFLAHPEVTGRALLNVVSLEVIWWIVGCPVFFVACEIEVTEGQFRFRRIFRWRTVPLTAITRVRPLDANCVYIRVAYQGKCYRLLTYLGEYDESSTPYAVKFLEEVCDRRNEPTRRYPSP